MKPRILILGAGVYQIPLIKKAKQRGYEALVASIEGNYPGIALADKYFNTDITNKEGVLSLAIENRISAIVTTGSDVSMPAIGTVVDKLGLIGPPMHIAEIVMSKTSFRSFLQNNGINYPDYASCLNASQVLNFYRTINDKIVIKPDDSSGSRGVTILDRGLEMEVVTKAYEDAIKHSRNQLVCVEAFLEGVEVGGNAFFYNDEIIYFTTTHKHMDGVLVRGHTLPGNLSEKDSFRVKNEIKLVAKKLGYKNGPMNFDVIINNYSIYILEIGLRNGGNGIVDIVYYSEGVDLTDWVLDYVLGITIQDNSRFAPSPISSFVFGTDRTGILKSVTDLMTLQRQVPQVFEMVLAKNLGDEVNPLIHNANLVGYMLLRCGSADYDKLSEEIRARLRIEVE